MANHLNLKEILIPQHHGHSPHPLEPMQILNYCDYEVVTLHVLLALNQSLNHCDNEVVALHVLPELKQSLNHCDNEVVTLYVLLVLNQTLKSPSTSSWS